MDGAKLDLAKEGCLVALGRCRAVVDHVTPEHYAQQVGTHSSIGAHIRHCLDHFTCLFRGLESGGVDYDARERTPSLETDPDVARQAIADAGARIEALSNGAVDFAFRCEIAPGKGRSEMASTLIRELAFLSSHTIHHVALMAVVANLAGIDTPEGIGLAYSTQTYLESQET